MMNTPNQDIWDIKRFLVYCAETHPNAQVADYVKRLHQSEFGTDYTVRSEEESLRKLEAEVAGLTDKMKRRPWFEPFCGHFCRMNLSVSKVLSVPLMNRIYFVSTQDRPRAAWFRFEEKLRLFWETCQEQPELFRFTVQEAQKYLREYWDAGCPVVPHSQEYRKIYEPAYRVVRKEYGKFPTLYAAIEECLEKQGSVNVCIDGNCGAGKSSAAELISTLFDCNIFHADDFFLPLEMRTPERMSEVGGNMDRERFRQEICENVRKGEPFTYRPFDCSFMRMGDPVRVEPKKINIFEGSYSMHPDLREYYDIKVFLSVAPKEQEARIVERNGRFMLRRFLDEWIPKENAYFDAMKVREASNLVF